MLTVGLLPLHAADERPALFPGDYPDPTIMRDGNDYYMTHSGFEYLPGLTVWHSTDLRHWTPVGSALTKWLGAVWAPDICKYKGKFYIYFTVASTGSFKTYVVTAENAGGPWSEPVDVGTSKVIDPCHVVDEGTGQRWLFVSGGNRIRLSADGLHCVGEMEHVYGGVHIPKDWVRECNAFEGPKVKRIGNYYYYLNAVGGTAGPPTSHSVMVARSQSVDGPWENCPSNPLVHTWSADERYWSKGHGSLVDDTEGRLWLVCHAYERDFLNLGRQTLMMRVRQNADGWLQLEKDKDAAPCDGRTKEWADALASFDIGKAWKFHGEYDPSRFSVKDGVLRLRGKGNDIGHCSPLLFVAGKHAYEFSVRMKVEGDASGGLTLYYAPDHYVAFTISDKQCETWKNGKRHGRGGNRSRYEWLKIRNDHNVVSAYRSTNGKDWALDSRSCVVGGYSHHTFGDFLSLLPGLFAVGDGVVEFSDFQFSVLNKAKETVFTSEGNPIVRHIYTADPTARVFGDKLYVYTSHDNAEANYFDMTDWHVFSTTDMTRWTDHGAFFSLDDISWANSMAWAPDCVERDGRYYLYYPVERTKIGVAVSDDPVHGFKDSGQPLIDNATDKELIGPEPIDPSVIVDNGQAYLYFGCRQLRMVKLSKDMVHTEGKIQKPVIIGNENDKSGMGGYYGEGPFIFKRGNIFYLMYSNGWGKESTLVYAMAKKPEGPFTFVGPVMPHQGCSTSHGSVVCYKGEWYLFYHDRSLSGLNYRRSICKARLVFDGQGRMKTVPTQE